MKLKIKKHKLKDLNPGDAFCEEYPAGSGNYLRDKYIVRKGRTLLHNHPFVEVLQTVFHYDIFSTKHKKHKIYDLDREVYAMSVANVARPVEPVRPFVHCHLGKENSVMDYLVRLLYGLGIILGLCGAVYLIFRGFV